MTNDPNDLVDYEPTPRCTVDPDDNGPTCDEWLADNNLFAAEQAILAR